MDILIAKKKNSPILDKKSQEIDSKKKRKSLHINAMLDFGNQAQNT